MHWSANCEEDIVHCSLCFIFQTQLFTKHKQWLTVDMPWKIFSQQLKYFLHVEIFSPRKFTAGSKQQTPNFVKMLRFLSDNLHKCLECPATGSQEKTSCCFGKDKVVSGQTLRLVIALLELELLQPCQYSLPHPAVSLLQERFHPSVYFRTLGHQLLIIFSLQQLWDHTK